MMRWIVGSSLKFRYLVVAVGAALMVFGVGAAARLAGGRLPRVRAAEGRDPDHQPRALRRRRSRSWSPFRWSRRSTACRSSTSIRSKSVPQLSSIELLFERGTDLLHARQLVQERVATVTPTLPTWASPPVMIQPLSSTSRVMKIGLSSDTSSADRHVDDRLLEDPGPAAARARRGERRRSGASGCSRCRCRSTRQKLQRARRLARRRSWTSTADALDAGLLQFSDGAVIGTGGFVDTPNQRLNVRHVLPIATPDDLAKVPIEKQNGEQLLARRRGRRWSRITSRWSATRSSTTAPASCSSSRSCPGPTPST